MERGTFQVEFVTPCFLAGAAGRAEWRAASIRGQLRWWFRAVAGGLWSGDLDRVRQAEGLLFGSTERKSLIQVQALAGPAPERRPLGRGRSGAELARLWGDESPEARDRLEIKKDGHEVNSNPVQYLGFGPIAINEIRPYLPARAGATFRLLWRPDAVEDETGKAFTKGLWAWLNLGGIGAKSRKGFGSLLCKEPNDLYRGPVTQEELRKQAGELLQAVRLQEGKPTWTHFSAHSRILISSRPAGSWEEALTWLGAWLIGFRRRYGSPGDPREIGGVPIANRDYEWAAPRGKHPRDAMPDRAGFGLPLPFRRKINGRQYGETVTWGREEGEEPDARRASPLLLRVSKLGGKFFPILTYLPSEFLPEGARLKFKEHPEEPFDVTDEQRYIIDRFLADLLKKKLIEEVAS